MKKIIWIIIFIFLTWLLYLNNHLKNKEIENLKISMQKQFNEVAKPSEIELINEKYRKTIIASQKLAETEKEALDLFNKIKTNKEQTIWKSRCLAQVMIWKIKDSCETNLERFKIDNNSF